MAHRLIEMHLDTTRLFGGVRRSCVGPHSSHSVPRGVAGGTTTHREATLYRVTRASEQLHCTDSLGSSEFAGASRQQVGICRIGIAAFGIGNCEWCMPMPMLSIIFLHGIGINADTDADD